MGSLKKIILSSIILLTATGCVKMEVSMDINKDKSMNLNLIEAVDKSLKNSDNTTEILEEEERKDLKAAGFTIENYSKDNMEGYQISKSIKNIDTISTAENITADLEISKLSKDKYMFTIKKGFFKNTYQAKISVKDKDEIYEESNDFTVNEEEDTNIEDEFYDDQSSTSDEWIQESDDAADWNLEDNEDSLDYSALMSSLDLKMKVNLPYKALSNNATTVEADGKTLTWDLLKLESDTIEFEFELYNTNNIIITIVLMIVVVILIGIIIRSKRKKQKISTNPVPEQNKLMEEKQDEADIQASSELDFSTKKIEEEKMDIHESTLKEQPSSFFKEEVKSIHLKKPLNHKDKDTKTLSPEKEEIKISNNIEKEQVEKKENTLTSKPEKFDIFTVDLSQKRQVPTESSSSTFATEKREENHDKPLNESIKKPIDKTKPIFPER